MAAGHVLPDCDLSDLNHTCLDQDILEPIAVIGLSVKFPQEATSAKSFWKMLVEGRSAMTDFPNDRFNIDAFYHPDNSRPGTVRTLHGGDTPIMTDCYCRCRSEGVTLSKRILEHLTPLSLRLPRLKLHA